MPRDYDARAGQRAVFDALIDARDKFGAKKPILEDQERRPLSYTDLIRASFALGRKIAALTGKGERVGDVAALQRRRGGHLLRPGRQRLRPRADHAQLHRRHPQPEGGMQAGGVRRILTPHRFIDQGKLDDLIDALQADCEIIYLEDVRASIGLPDRLYAAAAAALPRRFRVAMTHKDPGVILFTSGSFGAPRGVMLSQANLLANVDQIAAHIDLDPAWTMFNPLPVFHCFGLTAGALLPILRGIKAFQYPSPLHVKQIPPLIKDTGASVLFATDTFVNQYARSAEPGELSGLKFVVCGAEKVRDETHNLVAERFGNVPLLEGFGAPRPPP